MIEINFCDTQIRYDLANNECVINLESKFLNKYELKNFSPQEINIILVSKKAQTLIPIKVAVILLVECLGLQGHRV